MPLLVPQVFLLQKVAVWKCNMAGKPAIISRVVDTMTDTPRPTRAEATDVANAVLDGTYGEGRGGADRRLRQIGGGMRALGRKGVVRVVSCGTV